MSDDFCTWFEVGGLGRPSCAPPPRPGYGIGVGRLACPHCGKKIRWADGTNSPAHSDQAQGLRELAAKIWEGGNEVEGAHGRLTTHGVSFQPIKPYHFEGGEVVEPDYRAALVDLLAAAKRLQFARSGGDPEAIRQAKMFQVTAIARAEVALEGRGRMARPEASS